MNPKATFTISLCLNLALAGVAVWLLKKPGSPSRAETVAAGSRTRALSAASALQAPNCLVESVTYVTNHFDWSQIEAADFQPLAENLRAIGCPEKTIRDTVIARARRALAQVSREIEPKLPFWTAGMRRARAAAEAENQASLAREKILSRLASAIGQEAFLADPRIMNEFESQAIMRFMIGPVPEETFQKIAAKLVRFQDRSEALDARTQGVWLEADEAELAQLQAQYRRELVALLPPAQLEEMMARFAMLPEMDRVNYETIDLTAAEVRQLGLIRARIADPLVQRDPLKGDSDLTEEQAEALSAAQRQFLGEARYAQLERASDREFKMLFYLGQEEKLPREAAVKVYDLRQLTAQEVARLRQDESLSNEDRKQQLAQMQTDVQQAVLQVLGANANGQYLARGGAWLTNLNALR